MTFKELVFSEKNHSHEIYSKDLEKFILNHKYFNTNVTEYLNDFSNAYNISFETIKNDLIVSTFFKSSLILYKHVKNKSGWYESSINKYIDVVRKILELLLYIIHRNIDEINKIYLNDKIKDFDHYYFYLEYLSGENNKNFKIITGKENTLKISRNFIVLCNIDDILNNSILADYVYHPTGNHNLNGPTEDIQHLAYYFKINNEKSNVVRRIFSLDEPRERIISNSTDKSRRKALELKVFKIIDYIQPSIYKDEELTKETKKEILLQSKKELLSPLIDNKTANMISKNFKDKVKENSIDSHYKKFLVNKAISNSYIHKNVHLKTVYNKPSLPIFREFLDYLKKTWNENFFIDIIIFSIITGISVEKTIYSILDLDETFKYKKIRNKSSKLYIKVNKDSFADFYNLTENELSHKVKKEGEINLISAFEEKWLEIKKKLQRFIARKIKIKDVLKFVEENDDKDIKIDGDIIEDYVKNYRELQDFHDIKKYMDSNFSKKNIQDINKLRIEEYYITCFLKDNLKIYAKHLKAYPKNSKINLLHIHTLFYHYYQVYNATNDIQLLFTQKISTNDEARLTYCNTPKRLLVYEKWIYTLADSLNLDDYFGNELTNYKLTEIEYNPRVGSSSYIKDYQFKNFLQALNALECNDEITKVNIIMIFLRYVFSISLVSRDIINSSSNLSQISKRFRIITIQEKRKSLYQGKRIIPLTDMTLNCINVFEQLRTKYNISDTSPVLLFREDKIKEKPVTQSNVKKYLLNMQENEKNPYNKKRIEYIFKFVSYTQLNFGRHIITSEMVKKGVSSEYLDAIMNHHQLGKEDQGKYSNFYTSEYVNDIRKILEEIEERYIPNTQRGMIYGY